VLMAQLRRLQSQTQSHRTHGHTNDKVSERRTQHPWAPDARVAETRDYDYWLAVTDRQDPYYRRYEAAWAADLLLSDTTVL